MQIHLSPRHLTLTAAIHGFVAEKIMRLEDIANQILAAHVVLLQDESAPPARRFCVKVHLALPGPDVHASDTEADLYAAIDKVSSKLARQLRKRKTRLTDKRRSAAQTASERRRSGRIR
jgi:putative sigma-54 modulation protein